MHDAEKWKLKNYCGINSKRDEASLIKHQAKTTSLLAIKLHEVTERLPIDEGDVPCTNDLQGVN